MPESAEYTPTLEDMRAAWVSHRAFNNYERSFGKFWEVKADAEFTRWLETVRAEAKAEALELANSAVLVVGNPPYPSIGHMSDTSLRKWLAVARKAREMRAEK